MATIEEQIKDLNAQRMNLWEQNKEVLDRALARGTTPTQEELDQGKKIDGEMRRIEQTVELLNSGPRAEEERQTINEEFERARTPSETVTTRAQEDKQLRDFLRRSPNAPREIEIDLAPAAAAYQLYRQGARGGELARELRIIATDSGASGGSLTVPTTVATTIYAYMTASVAMRRIGAHIFTTSGGNSMKFPRVATHGIGTQIATQNTAIAGTDAVLGVMTLDAYDFGQLTAVSRDMIQDTGVDILGFVGENIGRAIGQVTATGYVAGSGSSTINGVANAVGGAGTIASGGSLFSLPAGQGLEKLIDLQYSVVDSYRQLGAAWLMRDITGASVRKIRDGAGGTTGQFVWQPSPTVGAVGGQPDTFLGDAVYFDPNVASMASDAKTVFYGHWGAYYIRDVAGFSLERSDDLYFDKAQSAFRGILRTDGDLIDSNALNCLHQAVA